MPDQELQPISKHSVVVKSNRGSKSDLSDRDRTDLIRLGKKPVLRVGLERPVKVSIKAFKTYISYIAEFWVHVDTGL